MRVGVLASGRGSNLQALLDAFPKGSADAEVVAVATNRRDAGAVRRAEIAGVPVLIAERRAGQTRESRHTAVAQWLVEARVELLVLAGFDEILTGPLLAPFAGRLINVHPALLPAFAGTLHAQREALAHGVKVTGCTVHYVNEEIDAGPIIAQAAVPVLEDDTDETLAARILLEEHRLLPAVVKLIANDRVRVEGRRVRITEGIVHASIAERL